MWRRTADGQRREADEVDGRQHERVALSAIEDAEIESAASAR